MIPHIDNFSGNIFNGTDPYSIEYIDTSIGYTQECKLGYEMLVSKKIGDRKVTDNIIDTRPVHVYFLEEVPEDVKNGIASSIETEFQSRGVCCTSWSELAEVFKLKPKTMCFNANLTKNQSLIEIVNMIETFTKLLEFQHKLTITLAVNKDTDIKVIKEAQKLNIIGIIPSSRDFTFAETKKGVHSQLNDIPYWPKHIIEQLPGAKKTEQKIKPGEIKLTPRQSQILHLIKDRGASNKVIAKHLNITESTVKLHVSIVLKKFNVKNRTQLALFSA